MSIISTFQNEAYRSRADLLDRFVAESKTINDTAENDREKVNVSLGLADFDPRTDISVSDTVSRADRLMYKNKLERKSGREVR